MLKSVSANTVSAKEWQAEMVARYSIDDEQKAANDLLSKKNSGQASPVHFPSLFSFPTREIDAAFKRAKLKAKGNGFKLLQTPLFSLQGTSSKQDRQPGKLLIITPRKFGKAHERNLIRRQLKAIFYEEKLYRYPYISLLLLYAPAKQLSFRELKVLLCKNIPPRNKKTKSPSSTSTKSSPVQQIPLDQVSDSPSTFRRIYSALRPFLGQSGVCIFTVTCDDYAEYHLKHTFLPLALLKILLRLLACNPITGILFKFMNKK